MGSPAVIVLGVLGLLALGAGVWRRSWRWWLSGYFLVAAAVVARLVQSG